MNLKHVLDFWGNILSLDNIDNITVSSEAALSAS